MGNDDSRPQPGPNVQQPQMQAPSHQVQQVNVSGNSMGMDEQQDIYILQPLQQLSLQSSPNSKHMFYWIDPKIFNSENQKYESYLKKYIEIQGFSSVDGLVNQLASPENANNGRKVKVICAASLQDEEYKRLQNDSRVINMYLFCQNQERAKLLMNNFSKIKAAKFDIVDLKDFLLQEIATDQGLDPKINVLITIDDDTNLMNKYRINFHSLTNGKSKIKAKKDFIDFVKKFYPESTQQINNFNDNYKVNVSADQSSRQAIQWLSKPGFFWQSTQILPKISTDPKKLAYLRFPFKQSYEGIVRQYRKNFKPLAQVYMALSLTEEQLTKLKQNQQNFLIFTSFAKAFTTEKKAKISVKKNSKSVFVRIMMKLPPKIAQNLDFGYVVVPTTEDDRPDVIFNIYNVFQIVQYEEDLNQFTFQYGSLAQVAYIRQKERGTRLTPYQQNLLRNYDYLQDITSRINSQATILQMSGHFQDSLLIHSQKLQQIRKSQPSQEVIDRHTIELGDAYRLNEQFSKAEQQYMSIFEGKMGLIANVHLAQLYFKTKQNHKLEKVINQIEKNLGRYKQISEPDSFKAQNYIGMELMNRGKFKEASKLYKNLAKEINAYYDFKFEGIPLVHEICRNRAACQTKLNNFTEALNLLDSTKGWQRICEGSKSPGLIITENLIKSVYQSKGEMKQVQQCQQQVQRIKRTAPKQQNLYLSRSGVFVNLNQSVINIQTSSSNQAPFTFQQGQPRQLLEQSAVNIDL